MGFRRDTTIDAPICRWQYGGLEEDLMPTDSKVLGFANRWYPLAVETAGCKVAERNNGGGDILASHDLEDIVNVLVGRPELLEEVENAPAELPAYLAGRFTELLMTSKFLDALPGMMYPDEPLADRTQVVTVRIRLLARQDTDEA